MGRGLLSDASAVTANGKPMRRKDFRKTAAGQVLVFEIPQGAESGPITVEQGSGTRVTTHEELRVDRFDELAGHLPLMSPAVPLRTPKGLVEVSAECSQGLIVDGELPGLPTNKPAGLCPVDVDVDRQALRAYTANAKETHEKGISEFDMSNPAQPQFVRAIDSGGANPTRVRLMQGGRIVAAAGDRVFVGHADKGLSPSEVTGQVAHLIGDPVEGRFVAAIMQDGSVTVIYPERPVRRAKLPGRPRAAKLAGPRIYVVNIGSDNVVSFDPMAPDSQSEILLSKGAKPLDLASDPQAREAWVTEPGLGRVAVIDTRTDKASEFPAGVSYPTFIALSPDGCVAVVYDEQHGDIAKIDPKRRSTFDSVQHFPDRPQAIALRMDAQHRVFLVLPSRTMEGPYRASCPMR